MTTIDKSKLKRIITQCGSQDEMDMVRAVWNAAQAEEREECARMLEISNSELLLMAGEMTVQELRNVRAVLNAMANKIRNKG